MLLANGLNTFAIKRNPVFNNALPKNSTYLSLPKNFPDCPILCKWYFDNFILAEELFAKDLQSFKTCVLVNNNLCRKLFSSLESPTIFDEIFKVTTVLFFIPDFFIPSYYVANYTILRLKYYIEIFYIDIILIQIKKLTML